MTSEGSREIEAVRKRLAAAKTQLSMARTMLNAAEKEEKEATEMLKDAEKRWEATSNNKRRKVSVSPQANYNNNLANIYGQFASYTIPSSSNDIDQIIVEGCGNTEFNGVYTLVYGFREDGAPVYHKRGKWKASSNKDFVIYRAKVFHSHHWYIGHWNGIIDGGSGRPGVSFYKNDASCNTPPENGWSATFHGKDPAPKCVLRNNDESV